MSKEDQKKDVAKAENQLPAQAGNIADQVLVKIQEFQTAGQLKLPQDYHAGNALKAAWLVLQETKDRSGKGVLESCSKASIANALLKYVVLGLNVSKKQCDFIAYGDQLTCSLEYTANEMLAKRYGMKDIFKKVVYKDDDFEDGVDDKGRTIIIKHKPTALDKRTKENIIGAYATVTMEDGSVWSEVMTMEMIRKAWEQGATKGNSPAHNNFADQMCLKSVSNRATKSIIRSSDDAALLLEHDKEDQPTAVEKLEANKRLSANVETVSFEEVKKESKSDVQGELTDKEKEEIAAEELEAAGQQNMFAENSTPTQKPGF